GYFLRKWNVDCSPDHRLRGPEYRLWLKDPMVLYGVENAVLAPGYQGRYVQAVQEAGET
ncbi:MAG: WYL domain-containing protein, partial [Azospira oryzae]